MIVVVCVIVPEVPVIVITYCPGATEDVVEMDRIELKLGVSFLLNPGALIEGVAQELREVPDTRLTVIE